MGRRRQIIGKSRLDSVDALMGSDWLRRQSELAASEAADDWTAVRENTRVNAARDKLLRIAGAILVAAAVILAGAVGCGVVWSIIGK